MAFQMPFTGGENSSNTEEGEVTAKLTLEAQLSQVVPGPSLTAEPTYFWITPHFFSESSTVRAMKFQAGDQQTAFCSKAVLTSKLTFSLTFAMDTFRKKG